jgi:hypothetical protein
MPQPKKPVAKAMPKKAMPKKAKKDNNPVNSYKGLKDAWGNAVGGEGTNSPFKKKVTEKATGEKYASKAAMMKHEKGEGKKMRMQEKVMGGKSGACCMKKSKPKK